MTINIQEYTDVSYDYIIFQLKDEEGMRLTTYNDTKEIKTIGIGHNLANESESIDGIINRKFKDSITAQEAELIFQEDLLRTLKSIKIPLKVHPKSVQYVIISLTFNLGWGGLSKFKHFLSYIQEKNYDYAVNELKNSHWYNQVGRRGPKLVNML